MASSKQLVYWNRMRGKKLSEETKSKMSLAHKGKSNDGHFIKGHIPWNNNMKGIHLSPNSEFKKGQVSNENHLMWKDEEAGYTAKHQWIRRHYGKATFCSFNPEHVSTRYEWANISGSYLRDVDDYAQLCKRCHLQYDLIRRGYTRKNKQGEIMRWLEN